MRSQITRLVLMVWIGTAWLLEGVPMVTAQGAAQSDAGICQARAENANVNIRAEPRVASGNIIGALRQGQALPVVARSAEATWYAVRYVDATGYEVPGAWVAAHVVRLEGPCASVLLASEQTESAEMAQLKTVPVLPALDAPRLRAIFERGQALGNDPRAFTKAGDCNTDTQHFLMAFDWGDYTLGPYTSLAPSIDYYAGWFEHVSLAGQVGYSAATLIDPLFADPSVCRSGEEGVLACEYRRVRPSVALMMFGPNDMLNLSEEQYRAALTEIVALSVEQGVIPVLTTFTWHPDRLWDKMLRFNLITVEVAQAYDVPLVNFWRAALDLPGLGLWAGYTHLTEGGFGGQHVYRIAFDGTEAISGHTLRNLLMLQTLDLLRRDVLQAG